MHVHAAKYNAHADRNNFASTNVDRIQITGVNPGRGKKWNNQQRQQNDEHSERRSNHQIEEQ